MFYFLMWFIIQEKTHKMHDICRCHLFVMDAKMLQVEKIKLLMVSPYVLK